MPPATEYTRLDVLVCVALTQAWDVVRTGRTVFPHGCAQDSLCAGVIRADARFYAAIRCGVRSEEKEV